MKDFSLIIDKVSKALGTTVDNVVKLYPQLRAEYSWYYVLDNLSEIASAFFVIGFVGLILVAFGALTEEGRVVYKVPICIAGIVVALLAITCVVTMLMKGFMCPDILIIERFIG